jgi:hypothetical protein
MRAVHHQWVVTTRPLIAMIRTRSLCQHEACVIAVAALDELVMQLVKTCHLRVPSLFFDWVADEATPLLEQQMADSFHHPKFAASLRQGDHRLVLASWMRHWVRPGLTARFAELLPHLPPPESHLPRLTWVLAPSPAVTVVPVSLPRARAHALPGLAVPA